MKLGKTGWLAVGHMCADLNQGGLPAILPFIIIQHHLSYAAAAGVVFMANTTSSVAQPIFGYLSDRMKKPRLMPLGLLLAGTGMAATGFMTTYYGLLLAAAISGIGIAAFHPEGARLAGQVTEKGKGVGLSIFAVGGNSGFALGPMLAAGAVMIWGLAGTWIFVLPAIGMSAVLSRQFATMELSIRPQGEIMHTGAENEEQWGAFFRLSIVVILRSIVFYGLNTFIPLYWVDVLQQSPAMGGAALTVLFLMGIIGTLIGGRMADRFGPRLVIIGGFLLLLPVLAGFTYSNVQGALFLLVPIGITLFSSATPVVFAGQNYLPNRVGLASGVTLGLAVSAGGMAAPGLGRLADMYGIGQAFQLLAILPLVTALVAMTLPKDLQEKG